MVQPAADQILFRCHACRQKYAVRPARIGAKFKCTKCQAVLQVPTEKNSLDRPEASKPKVRVQSATVVSSADSINELSFDDLPALSVSDSVVMEDLPKQLAPSASPEATSLEKAAPPSAVEKSEPSTDAAAKAPAAIPPGKKACPHCHHVCPGMALSCPLCMHRFEAPKPKAKPAGDSVVADAVDAKDGKGKGDSKANAKALSKAGAPALKPKRDIGKALDNAVQVRGKGEGRYVEPPMWMDEVIYGTAFKLGSAGLCCLGAALVIFFQLDSPEAARNAFFLIRWIYQLCGFGNHTLGRLIPVLLCMAAGIAFLYFAIKPVVDHLKRERELQKPIDPFQE